ncbi:hypothetical protein FIC_00989 [Flavobacteriaceae bacterium 3519-10]|nr:hypothetical protein FIC_00989 [Flavobacteriaceae bacterium 3519-10]
MMVLQALRFCFNFNVQNLNHFNPADKKCIFEEWI